MALIYKLFSVVFMNFALFLRFRNKNIHNFGKIDIHANSDYKKLDNNIILYMCMKTQLPKLELEEFFFGDKVFWF